MLRELLERWKNWLGDHELEQAIRDELVRHRYPRQASRIEDAQMVAIERPGWVQVWQFRVETNRDGEPVTLYGAVRDDGRHGTEVELSIDPQPVAKQLAVWSEGLIVRLRAR
ncbi:hypothetical protein NG895_28750 [Aeoliella sp. ICT_H6.2]|uniref:Uncharacterized protein n=1 Tax=Aeoliella straminimaris TaxID=2954799 RepID=A0A9X2FGF2_9BACT|nr:hypothetical protein [Aeoliella straminimaris]MCO6047913.1 hypothetical protein [Aeoliella straminimaris]